MSTRLMIWHYQFLLLMRNKQLLISFLILIALAFYAILYGQHFRERQQTIVQGIEEKLAINDSIARKFVLKIDTSSEIRKQNFQYRPMAADVIMRKFVVYKPSEFSALSIGQKDTYPYYHDVNTNNSLHSSVIQEMHNPNKLQAGNFDLSFIIIYLIPLLIIALSYNVISGEQDLRTYTLLRIQIPISKLIIYKLEFQFILVIGLVLFFNIAGFLISGLTIQDDLYNMLVWISINVLYILFWFSICYLIISFNSSSSLNALLLGSIWIILVMVVPSAINNISNPPNEDEMIKSTFRRGRETDVHHELTQQQALDSFYRLKHPYPVPIIKNPGAADIMHAQRELINREANMYAGYVIKRQKNQFNEVLAYGPINPIFITQYAFNQVAATELNSYLMYLDSAESYQTKRRYYIYDLMMNRKDFGIKEYEKFPEFTFQQPTYTFSKFSKDSIYIAGIIVLCLGIGFRQTKKRFL
ncbi:ABC transporter permease subunit [Sphingobacterium humi]|nr:ABC transporter permease subunit [Sphingobacterium humi]